MTGTTTIQLSLKVRSLLDNVKREIGARSYADAIVWLAKRAKVMEKSELGLLPKLHTFRREKHDRFD
ncbi:MAG: hypothetical protein KGH66_00515 [Candidatus Micrarchaeota archaeon]|nr:hypothetical protein [Candidatus Micrarchaeota archaeon]